MQYFSFLLNEIQTGMVSLGKVIDLAVRLQHNRYASVPCLYLESKLSDVCKLVTLKQPSGGVLENRGGDALNQVQHPLFQILVWLSLQNRFLEDDTECLRVCKVDTTFSSISICTTDYEPKQLKSLYIPYVYTVVLKSLCPLLFFSFCMFVTLIVMFQLIKQI